MLEAILSQPVWLQAWIFWMGTLNLASLCFLRRSEARWVLVAFIASALVMQVIFEINGYNRLLGLAHVIFWTPLLTYLYHRGAYRPIAGQGAFGLWLPLLFFTDLTSLLIDYVDVARYLAGDHY